MEKAKKVNCYKRQIHKQLLRISRDDLLTFNSDLYKQ